MVRDRADLRWQHLEERWQRLLWARDTAGYRSAAAFARAIGEKEHTYKAYERDPDSASKATPLEFSKARAWAEKLNVRWEWLLDGQGVPWTDASEETPAAQVGRLVQEAAPEDQERILRVVQAMVGERKAG